MGSIWGLSGPPGSAAMDMETGYIQSWPPASVMFQVCAPDSRTPGSWGIALAGPCPQDKLGGSVPCPGLMFWGNRSIHHCLKEEVPKTIYTPPLRGAPLKTTILCTGPSMSFHLKLKDYLDASPSKSPDHPQIQVRLLLCKMRSQSP